MDQLLEKLRAAGPSTGDARTARRRATARMNYRTNASILEVQEPNSIESNASITKEDVQTTDPDDVAARAKNLLRGLRSGEGGPGPSSDRALRLIRERRQHRSSSSRTSHDLPSDMQTERIEGRGTSRTSSALPSDTQTDEFEIRDRIALPSDMHTGNEERNTLRTRNASPPDIQIGRVKELDNGVSEEQDEEQIDQMRNQEANKEARDDSSIYPEDYENDSSTYLEDDGDDDSRYSDEDASHTPTED